MVIEALGSLVIDGWDSLYSLARSEFAKRRTIKKLFVFSYCGKNYRFQRGLQAVSALLVWAIFSARLEHLIGRDEQLLNCLVTLFKHFSTGLRSLMRESSSEIVSRNNHLQDSAYLFFSFLIDPIYHLLRNTSGWMVCRSKAIQFLIWPIVEFSDENFLFPPYKLIVPYE